MSRESWYRRWKFLLFLLKLFFITYQTPKPRPETATAKTESAKNESARTDSARTDSSTSLDSESPRTDRTNSGEANATSSPSKILSRKSSVTCQSASEKESVLVKVPYSKSRSTVSRPGSTMARPIPEAVAMPRDPDEELVHITVSLATIRRGWKCSSSLKNIFTATRVDLIINFI